MIDSVNFNVIPGQRIIELGCGENPHPQCQVRVDSRSLLHVDFQADFNEILPVKDQDFEGVYSAFVIEHLTWTKVRQFISEVFRILKPDGKAVIITANVEAQMEWIRDHPDGWNGKPLFESASELIFGSQSYSENVHKNFLIPTIAIQMFADAGFEKVTVQPFGDAGTDMMIEATRPILSPERKAKFVNAVIPGHVLNMENVPVITKPGKVLTRSEMFDREYFDGGTKVGGYKRDNFGAYRDFPVHEITARHILARCPESVLELGAGRGYVLKRIQDKGIPGCGLEISKHCYMTRVADGIEQLDLCVQKWTGFAADLCYSVAVLEHIPEEHLPVVIDTMRIRCRRGLHGIDFGHKDDGFDKTHCTLKPKSWWLEQFGKYAPGWPVEIVDKEELERGEFPQDVLKGDGKVKLNVGSFTTMFHHGWINLDVHDLGAFAQQNGYNYQRCDVRAGLPYGTGTVDLIFACHMFEHLTYKEGRTFLKECRRVLKPDTGAMRVLVPDAELLNTLYTESGVTDADVRWPGKSLSDFGEISEGVANASTDAERLWELLHAGHQSCYDSESLRKVLIESGFQASEATFRHTSFNSYGMRQLLYECLDMLPCLTLYMEAIPAVG